MTRTPWGDASRLRERRLTPRRGEHPEVTESQRERLFAAMVAVVAEQGYEQTSVADLVELAGVSRTSFYVHFRDKQECFVATLEEIVRMTIAVLQHEYQGEGTAEERARRTLDAINSMIVGQPAAARLCLVEAYAAGAPAIEAFELAVARFEEVVQQGLEGLHGGARIPIEIVQAVVGGLRKVMHTRLRGGRQAELPELVPQMWQWALAYEAPPLPLDATGAITAATPAPEAKPRNAEERALAATVAAMAAHGYRATTVADLAAAASMSLTTFYASFDGKQAVLLEALRRGHAELFAAGSQVFRDASDWPEGVATAIGTMLSYLDSHPDFARLSTVEVYAAGPEAMTIRDSAIERFGDFLAAGYEASPNVPKLAAEAIGGAVFWLLYDEVRNNGPGRSRRLAPMMAFIALAPFLGTAEAGAIAAAAGGGRGRSAVPATARDT